MKHGTVSGYTDQRCRCDDCRLAMSEYQRAWRARRRGEEPPDVAPDENIADLLHELFPFGLTDDCPARRAMSGDGGNLRR